jgi:hypothetical protein
MLNCPKVLQTHNAREHCMPFGISWKRRLRCGRRMSHAAGRCYRRFFTVAHLTTHELSVSSETLTKPEDILKRDKPEIPPGGDA